MVNKRNVFFGVLLLLGAAGIILYVSLFSGLSVQDILDYSPSSLPLAAAFFIAIYCIRTLVMVIPMLLLYIGAGMIFPAPLAILVTYAGLFCEMTLGYLIGRRIGREKVLVQVEQYKKAAAFLKTVKNAGPLSCFLSRIFPLAYDLVSMFFGASGMSYRSYVCYSLLGVTPGMIPFVISGNSIDDPLSREFLIPFAAAIIIVVTAFFVSRLFIKKKSISP
ncbi:VTT domain-containing protein [Treponema sp. OttesenSCG-928-L16]|nr:VTT domain-containing protein [Treponema sp. OttesenSCG-928-L16]